MTENRGNEKYKINKGTSNSSNKNRYHNPGVPLGVSVVFPLNPVLGPLVRVPVSTSDQDVSTSVTTLLFVS